MKIVFSISMYFFAFLLFFFLNDPATTEIYPLSLHDALPIYHSHMNVPGNGTPVAIIPRLAILPLLQQPLREPHHGVRVRRDAPAMERRLHQPPLPQPKIAFARQQPVAKQPLVGSQDASLDEFAVLRHQHLLDVLRVAHKVNAKTVVAQRNNVAIFARQPSQIFQRTPAVLLESPSPSLGNRPRRQLMSISRFHEPFGERSALAFGVSS